MHGLARVDAPGDYSRVDIILTGMSDPPTLLELLTAAFVVNGGMLFKHGPSLQEEEDEEQELTQLMEEMEALGATPVSNEGSDIGSSQS